MIPEREGMRAMSGSGLEWSRVILFYLTLFLWTRRMDGLADFSNYLSRIITSHSALACDGQSLRLRCPRHSTISIQSAFYGRGDARLCAVITDPETRAPDNHSCTALTALQKLLSECQSHRDCQLSVNHLLFGRDPCPGTLKYLQVDYKCKPTEHRSHVGCEGERLVLRCKAPRVLNIYAAVYGRSLSPTHTCPSSHLTRPPPFECLNHDAVHTVSQFCYSKQRCVIAVGNQTFRDPCSPGTRKYLNVLYACVPQALLREADPHIPRSPSTPTLDIGKVLPADVATRPFPKGSRLPENSGAMMSSSLMTYAYIKEHRETAALLFTSSVCVGLLLTLLAVSVRVTCRGRLLRDHRPSTESTTSKVQIHNCKKEEEDDEDDDEEDETDSSLISATDRKLVCGWEEVTYMTEAAERDERIERREMVIQEIWMNAYLNGTYPGLD